MLRPPVGVAIIGFFALMAGIAYLLIGLRLTGTLVFGPAELGSGFGFWGILTILTGLAFAAAAIALWAVQPWAWMFAMILAGFGLLDAVLVWISTGNITDGLSVALLPLVVLWYLNSTEVRGAFGVERT
jgi:hypothetical protein